MRLKKIILRVLAAVIAVGLCIGAYVLATSSGSPGSSSDPLVSLSYVTDVLTPQLESYVEQKIAAESNALKAAFNQKVLAFSNELGQAGHYVPPV